MPGREGTAHATARATRVDVGGRVDPLYSIVSRSLASGRGLVSARYGERIDPLRPLKASESPRGRGSQRNGIRILGSSRAAMSAASRSYRNEAGLFNIGVAGPFRSELRRRGFTGASLATAPTSVGMTMAMLAGAEPARHRLHTAYLKARTGAMRSSRRSAKRAVLLSRGRERLAAHPASHSRAPVRSARAHCQSS